MTWRFEKQSTESGEHYQIFFSEICLSYRDLINLWKNNEAFCLFFIDILKQSDHQAYRFETPALNDASLDLAFEFVLLASPELIKPADPIAFQKQFENLDCSKGIVSFTNLSKDSLLTVPVYQSLTESVIPSYSHLADFTRHAQSELQTMLWQQVARNLEELDLSLGPYWLSTAGAGVPWLHVRIDKKPKYYHYNAYCDETN